VVSTPSKKEPALPPRTPRTFCDQPDLAPPPVKVLHSLLTCKKHTAGEPTSVELMSLSCCWSQCNVGSRSIQVVTFIDDNWVLFFRAQGVFACHQRSHRIACNSRGAEKSGAITCGHCDLKRCTVYVCVAPTCAESMLTASHAFATDLATLHCNTVVAVARPRCR